MNALKLNRFTDSISAFYRIMLLIFCVLEVALLWAMSVFFICYVSTDTNEVTFFCKDNAVLNILLIAAFIIVLFLLKKKSVISSFKEKLSDDIFFKKTKKIMLWTIAIIGLLWIVITQYVPGADQLDVMASAYKYGIGETDMVRAGGYLDRWPHNIGITTIERLLAYVVGDFNIMFMQLLNVPGLVLIYKYMIDTWDRFNGSRFSQVCTLGCGILFYPMIMYVSFVYGNIWSVTFALIAFNAELNYFEDNKVRSLIKCLLAVGLSFMAKGSGIIFIIALAIFAIVRGAIDKIKVYKIVLIIVAMCITVGVFSTVPKKILIETTGINVRNDGIWAFVAMALQENGTAPGWYNGYCLDVYYQNNGNTEVAEQVAKEETFDRLNYLFSDKHHAFQFFSKKIASMWIEPTYEGYWINQVRAHRVAFPGWLETFMSGKGYVIGAKIFDYFGIIILTGTLLWLILEDKAKFNDRSFLLLSFVGGFTFSLMWEAKSQYNITYFILLFPYAMSGFEMMLDRGRVLIRSANKVIIAYTCATIVLFLAAYKLDGSNCLSQHNDAFNTYISEWRMNDLTETVNEINAMKAWIKGYQEQCTYYQKLLNDNGITY